MSFQQGLSGLNAMSKNLDVIGNNVANANTYGAKSSRAEFADMYANAVNGAGRNFVGIGVTVATVAQQFTQGNITATENPMDVAINGGGFYQLTDGQNPITYSRNGQFKLDSSGYVVNDQGLKLVGYPADTSGFVQVGQPGVLQVPTAGVAAKATSKIGIELNLSQQSAVTDAAKATPPSINFSDPSTYNTTAELNVYDPKGTSIPVTFYLQRTAADSNQWNVYAKANGTSLGGTDAVPAPITTLTFDGSGTLTSTPTMSLDIPATNTGAGEIPTTPIAGIALDWSNSTEYAGKSAATSTTQDGFAPGTYAGMVIDAAGVMTVRYSNGQSKAAGQLELATFRNPQGLEPVGGNGWKRTATSGDPVAGIPGTGNLGVLQSGALEESNVDLTGELVNMITAQRSYQANAQTIKTMDQVLQTLVSLR